MNLFQKKVHDALLLAKYTSISNYSSSFRKCQKIPKGEYMPQVILDEMIDMVCMQNVFVVRNTLINLYIQSNKQEYHAAYLLEFIKTCVVVIEEVFKKKLDTINITIIMSKKHKHFPKDKVFKSENVNSGLSYDNNIIVYRVEELCKVIIHEMLHIYSIHFRDYDPQIDLDLIHNNNINHLTNRSLHIYEAYVEMCAVLLNTIIYERITTDKRSMKKESEHQSYLIHQFQTFEPFYQKTNVYAYIYLKYDLWSNMNAILNDLQKDNYCAKSPDLLLKYQNKSSKSLKKHARKTNHTNIRFSQLDIFKKYLDIVHKCALN